MGKRGSVELMWFWMYYLGLVVAVYLTLSFFVRDKADGTSFRQQYESKKVSLALDTLGMSNADASLVLSRDAFSYTIDQGIVHVQSHQRVSSVYAPWIQPDLSVTFTDTSILLSRTMHDAS